MSGKDCKVYHVMGEKEWERVQRVAKALGTAPCNVADMFGLSPVLLERWLAKRGIFVREGDSLAGVLKRRFGVDLLEGMGG